MTTTVLMRSPFVAGLGVALVTSPAAAQRSQSGPMRDAAQADLAGNTQAARNLIQRIIDFWKTREVAEPQNAFYQQGEMANEGARVCIDAGDLDTAESAYRLGYQLGNTEPAPRTHPKSLWDFRLAHALGRIAARRGNEAEARSQIALARQALDSDSAMAAQQERFFPYLVGYVALYTGDLATAEVEIKKAVAVSAGGDPFQHALLGMVYEKQGRADDARLEYRKAYEGATARNPPAAFARPFARKKLGIKEP